MKVIKKGIMPPYKWWNGKIVTCENCGQTCELEDKDDLRSWIRGSGKWVIGCDNCKQLMIFNE